MSFRCLLVESDALSHDLFLLKAFPYACWSQRGLFWVCRLKEGVEFLPQVEDPLTDLRSLEQALVAVSPQRPGRVSDVDCVQAKITRSPHSQSRRGLTGTISILSLIVDGESASRRSTILRGIAETVTDVVVRRGWTFSDAIRVHRSPQTPYMGLLGLPVD